MLMTQVGPWFCAAHQFCPTALVHTFEQNFSSVTGAGFRQFARQDHWHLILNYCICAIQATLAVEVRDAEPVSRDLDEAVSLRRQASKAVQSA